MFARLDSWLEEKNVLNELTEAPMDAQEGALTAEQREVGVGQRPPPPQPRLVLHRGPPPATSRNVLHPRPPQPAALSADL